MLVRTLILMVMAASASGCTSSRPVEPYELTERVATISRGNEEVTIWRRLRGVAIWIPIQDTTQVRLNSYVVEFVSTRGESEEAERIGVELIRSRGVSSVHSPWFLGTSDRFCFFGVSDGYLTIEIESGIVKHIECESRFLEFGEWRSVDSETILRVTDHGQFELSAQGLREVEK